MQKVRVAKKGAIDPVETLKRTPKQNDRVNRGIVDNRCRNRGLVQHDSELLP